MSISFGPRLGLLYNALIGESYFDSLRLFLQNIDALLQGSVINATQSAPPVSPNPGDAYLLTGGTPSGVWTGKAGQIAFWDAQLTISGTNTVVPGWVFLVPQAGWIVWNVAVTSLIVFNGTSWSTIGGGANFPTNTDITSMTGIPNTTINTSGYIYNDGTDLPVTISSTGVVFGANYNSGTPGAGVTVANQAFTGTGYTGIGVGVGNGTTGSILGAGYMSTAFISCQSILAESLISAAGQLRVGDGASQSTPGVIQSYATGQSINIGPLGTTTNKLAVGILAGQGSPAYNVGLLGLEGNYYTQTTVGSAGSASAPPASPSIYVPIDINGTVYVFAGYAQA
jgi:hypothetical protein